uniref:Uncharacterized protein n=1 Tax=Peronospora matthiolae TaxID=2874970 RepID=A0AAV1T1J7_9STRA
MAVQLVVSSNGRKASCVIASDVCVGLSSDPMVNRIIPTIQANDRSTYHYNCHSSTLSEQLCLPGHVYRTPVDKTLMIVHQGDCVVYYVDPFVLRLTNCF